jgi:hypothetical protein
MAHRQSTESKIVIGFFKALWWIISLPFKLLFGGKSRSKYPPEKINRDPDFTRNRWREINELMRLGSPSNYARAVLEADKLLDHALKSLRVPGLTMGDRLKAAKNKFSPEGYDAAWRAHRVRNELVHNAEFQIMDYTARDVLKNYEKAIKEVVNI